MSVGQRDNPRAVLSPRRSAILGNFDENQTIAPIDESARCTPALSSYAAFPRTGPVAARLKLAIGGEKTRPIIREGEVAYLCRGRRCALDASNQA